MPHNALHQIPSTSQPGPAANSAIAQCCAAWTSTYQAEIKHGGQVGATFRAGRAYRAAMPLLVGHQNIRDFIACTAHGSLLGAISDSQCTKLLYAAQVALGAERTQPRQPGSSPAS